MHGLYIHIPFCDRICRYCDFAKIYTDVLSHERYVQALILEYEQYKNKHSFTFDTVYFGGGTPSALTLSALELLLQYFAKEIDMAEEVTFEANPESLTEEKIAMLKKYGVNRVSLGVQTFNEKQLRFLNRSHTVTDIYRCFELLRKYDIANINVDLIYALPNQTLNELIFDLSEIEKLNPTHIATYALIFEPHTTLFLQLEEDKVVEVDEDTQEQMYRLIQATLQKKGYVQYEFSNWAKPDCFSKHNTKYWQLLSYLGIGLGSHGFLAGIRYANTRSIVNYVEQLEQGQKVITEEHQVTEKELMEEMMFLGLRLHNGVEKAMFKTRFNCDVFAIFGEPLTYHIEQGNIIETSTHLRLSEEALFISNHVLSDFLL